MTTPIDHQTRRDDEAAIRAVRDELYAAWADNDADAFAALYVDDATVVMPGTYHADRDQIRTSMAAGFAGPLKGSRAIDEPLSIRFLGDDAAIVISDAGILMAGMDTVPPEQRVRATWAFTRLHGEWLIAAYHNCPING